MCLISIIIPVYNAEDYIDECFNSVSNINDSIEIILIDDKSTDNSRSKLIEYSKRHANVKTIFHNNNIGVSEARNSGLNIAIGKYIIFLDSDDFIYPNSFNQLLYQIHTNLNIDVYIVNAVSDHLAYNSIYYCNYNKVYSNVTVLKNISSLSHNLDIGVCWRYIIKRDILTSNNITFLANARIYEDQEFFVRVFTSSANYFFLKNFHYHHNVRNNSISQNINFYCMTSCLHVLISLIIMFEENKSDDLSMYFIFSRIKAMLIVLVHRLFLCSNDELVSISNLFNKLINKFKCVEKFSELFRNIKIIHSNSKHLSIEYYNYYKKRNINLIPSCTTNIFIYCAGILGKGIAKILQDESYNIIGFIDDEKSIRGKKIYGLEVFSKNDVRNYMKKNDDFHVLICTQRKNIIKILIEHLVNLGLSKNRYSIAYSEFTD